MLANRVLNYIDELPKGTPMSVAAKNGAILAGMKGPVLRLRDGQNRVSLGCWMLALLPCGNFIALWQRQDCRALAR